MPDMVGKVFDSGSAVCVRSGVQSARSMLEGFGRGKRVIGLTGGQFSLIDLLEALLEVTGPADVVVATWTAGVRDAALASELNRTGKIRSMRLVVDRSFSGRQPQYVARVEEMFGREAIRVTQTHAKFLVIQNDEWNVLVQTSMNLNRNSRVESFAIDEDQALCSWWMSAAVEPLWADLSPGMRPGEKEVYEVFERHWGWTEGDEKEVPTTREAFAAGTSGVRERGGWSW